MGDTVLIDTKKAIKHDFSQDALPDDTAGSPELPETGIENSSKNIESNTKNLKTVPKKRSSTPKIPQNILKHHPKSKIAWSYY